jgi:hypothetical protein
LYKSGVGKIPLHKCRRLNSRNINITSGVQETAKPNLRNPSHGGKTITSGLEEIPLIQEDRLMAEKRGDF